MNDARKLENRFKSFQGQRRTRDQIPLFQTFRPDIPNSCPAKGRTKQAIEIAGNAFCAGCEHSGPAQLTLEGKSSVFLRQRFHQWRDLFAIRRQNYLRRIQSSRDEQMSLQLESSFTSYLRSRNQTLCGTISNLGF
jgi:hypothetical protein